MLLLGAQDNDWVWNKINFLVVQRNLFWQMSRDGNMHGLGIHSAMTASPKLSFRTPLRMSDMVVRGTAGWTTSKSGHPCSCQNFSVPPAERTGSGSLLNLPSCPPVDAIGQGTELN